MQSVRRQDTTPELRVAALLAAAGLFYVRHPVNFPGRPDFYFPVPRVALFVHGCFWHGHGRCRKGTRRPTTRPEYWANRIARNQERDQRVARCLRRSGVGVWTLWECELGAGLPKRLLRRLTAAG